MALDLPVLLRDNLSKRLRLVGVVIKYLVAIPAMHPRRTRTIRKTMVDNRSIMQTEVLVGPKRAQNLLFATCSGCVPSQVPTHCSSQLVPSNAWFVVFAGDGR